ncbi:MAG: flavin reductase family protein [Methanobacteriota archaeon]
MRTTDLDAAFRAFTTTVGLITTNGRKGPNVMAAEWTFHVSYEPFLIAVLVDPENATHAAIQETGEFGVNLVAEDQAAAMGFAGHFSKHDTDKLSSELFETYPGGRIQAPMLKGALLNAECRVVKEFRMGDHTAFVGEVLAFSVDPTKQPVVLHRGARRLGARIERPRAIVLAVTPMHAERGRTVSVDGELAGPGRAGASVDVALVGPEGPSAKGARVQTDAHGHFSVGIDLPGSLKPGAFVVEARTDGAVGRARLDVF